MLNLQTLKLAGNAGINFDLEPCDLDPNFFTNGNDFRLRNGKIQSFNTGDVLSVCPTPFHGAKILFVNAAPSYFFLVAGLTAVFCFDGTNWTDISSTDGYVDLSDPDQFKWTTCLLGNIPVINNVNHYPEYWSPQAASQILLPLQFSPTETWKQKDFHCKVMRAHKNFLFAINMSEGGTALPYNYRWSHPADNNGLPYTWDPLDLASIAGQASILGNAGELIDGLSMRDSFCLYSTNSVNILDYIGGEFIWSARALSSNQGLLTQNCVVDVYGRHYFLSRDDILVNDGNSINSIAHRSFRTKLAGTIDPRYYYKSYAVVDHSNKEIWFCVPQIGSTFPDLAFVYNYLDEKVSIRDIDPSIVSMTYGLTQFSSSSWNSLTNTWLEALNPWNYDPSSPFAQGLIGIEEPTTTIYNMSSPEIDNETDTFVERVSAQLTDQREVTTISRVFPHIQSTGSVRITFGSQYALGAPVRWGEPQLFTPNNDRKIEPRTTGMLHSWKIETYQGSQFSYSGMDIEFTVNGQR